MFTVKHALFSLATLTAATGAGAASIAEQVEVAHGVATAHIKSWGAEIDASAELVEEGEEGTHPWWKTEEGTPVPTPSPIQVDSLETRKFCSDTYGCRQEQCMTVHDVPHMVKVCDQDCRIDHLVEEWVFVGFGSCSRVENLGESFSPYHYDVETDRGCVEGCKNLSADAVTFSYASMLCTCHAATNGADSISYAWIADVRWRCFKMDRLLFDPAGDPTRRPAALADPAQVGSVRGPAPVDGADDGHTRGDAARVAVLAKENAKLAGELAALRRENAALTTAAAHIKSWGAEIDASAELVEEGEEGTQQEGTQLSPRYVDSLKPDTFCSKANCRQEQCRTVHGVPHMVQVCDRNCKIDHKMNGLFSPGGDPTPAGAVAALADPAQVGSVRGPAPVDGADDGPTRGDAARVAVLAKENAKLAGELAALRRKNAALTAAAAAAGRASAGLRVGDVNVV